MGFGDGGRARVDNSSEGMYIGDFRRIYNDSDFVNQVYKKFNAAQDGYLTVEEYETAADLWPAFKKLKEHFEDIARNKKQGPPVAQREHFIDGWSHKLSPSTHLHIRNQDKRELGRLYDKHSQSVDSKTKSGDAKLDVLSFTGYFNVIKDRGPMRDKFHTALKLKKYISDDTPLMILFDQEKIENWKRRRTSRIQERQIEEWTPREVHGYFDTLHRAPFHRLRRYANRFLDQNINGAQLLELDAEKLREIGITNSQDIKIMLTHLKNLAARKLSLTVKVEMAARFKRPIAVEVHDTDTIADVKDKLEEAIRELDTNKTHVPSNYCLMANGKRLLDPDDLRGLDVLDNQTLFLIEEAPMDQWSKHQVSLWIRAHGEFEEYSENFLVASLSGNRLVNIKESDVRNFVNGKKERIKIGKQKDLVNQIRRCVNAWQEDEDRRRPVQKEAGGGGGGASFEPAQDDNRLAQWTLGALIVLALALFLCNKGFLGTTCQANLANIFGRKGKAPATAPKLFATNHPVHADGIPHFVDVGVGQCLTSSGRKPRYHWTPMQGARRKLADCQNACTDLAGCTGIAYQAGRTEQDTAICAVYHGTMGAGPMDWRGPYNPEHPGVPLDSTKVDEDKRYNCFRMERRKQIANEKERLKKLEDLEKSVKQDLKKGPQKVTKVVEKTEEDSTETATLRLNIPFPKTKDEMASLRQRVKEELIRETGEQIEIMSVVDGSSP